MIKDVFEMELAVGFEEMENSEQKRDEPPPHPLVRWGEFLSLGSTRSQKNFLGDPLAHEEG